MANSRFPVSRRQHCFGGRDTRGQRWLALGCTVAAASMTADLWAQEVTPRPSLAGPTTAQLRPPADYTMRYGDVRFLVEPAFTMEFNDNISWSATRRLSDLILEPKVDLGIYWPVTEFNALHAAIGVGYQVYTKHTEFNSPWPLISPNSALEWNIYTGDFRIQVHDRFSYLQDLSLRAAESQAGAFYNVSDQARFSRFDNLAGFNVDWDLNQLVLTLGFDHENFFMTGAQYTYLNRVSELPAFSLALRVSDPLRLGVETRARISNYQENVLADRWEATAGPFFDWRIAEHLSVRGGGGYATTQLTADMPGVSDISTYYAYARLNYDVNWFLTQSLSVGRETQPGFNAQYLQDAYLRYTAQWRLFSYLDVVTRANLLFAHEFGGSFDEHFDYYTLGAELGWRFHERWRAFLAYDFTEKLSNLAGADYHQNRVQMGVSYHF
jgi:hypothetical protein